ncbi:thioesterase family protein [Aquabacterium olei]|uniref:Thioesterase family protein n=1 Tax=Aquabacterium olei TaxID=1296669 RepID=A0A2U8FSS5_9BURK|nr:thioesterase family protein [Aquabacterium olei]AWI54079.1 thioesterase family protein [Aquabacterium olei]
MSDTAPTLPLQTLPELLATRTPGEVRVRFHVGADWGQGRTTFGGLLSLLAVQAMRDVCGTDWPLRALQTSFVGPVVPGPVDIEVHLLRQGKNVRQVQARLLQADGSGAEQVAGVLLGVFGTGRDSTLPALNPARPDVDKDPDAALKLPFIPGLTPNFTQHLEFRVAEGGLPFTGAENWHSRTHVRVKQPGDVDAELQAVLMADAGPTPALQRLNGFAPASSVSWALELRPVALSEPAGFWRMDKDALVTGEGYVNERTTLWTPCGQLAALGYQVVAVYA